MIRTRLTEKIIRSTQCPSDKKVIVLADTEVRNLTVHIGKINKTYRFYGQVNKIRYNQKIDSTNDVRLVDARVWVLNFLSEINSNRQIVRSNMSISEACDRFLFPYYTHHVKDKNPLGIIDNFIVPYFGNIPIAKLTAMDVQKVVYILMKVGYAAETIRKRVLVGKVLYKQLIKHRLVLFNPFDHLDLPTVSNIRTVTLTQEQRYPFIQCCLEENSVFSDLILLLVFTGLRVSEATCIKFDDISDDFGSLNLPSTKAGVPQQIALNSYAQEILQRRAKLTWNDYLFPSPVKTDTHIVSLRDALYRIKKHMTTLDFDISNLTLHDLRRTFASTLAEVTGGDLQMVAQQIRHSSIHVLKRYIHRQRSDVIAASEAAAQALITPIRSNSIKGKK